MNNSNERLEALFEAAVALETDAQRTEYLARACPDPEVRRQVQSLLAAHRNPDPVLVETTIRVDVPPAEQVGTLIGRYKLLETLGEGGFGAVWLAEQREPVRRKIALKVIKLGMDTRSVVARFEAERQALALMDHPNIAKVLDAGTTDTGRPYFVMELVRGIPVTRFCDENKLATRERLDLFIKVCHAVQHAHQKGIIHRDLKPSNVLVTLHDGVPVPKVIDFGIAKATQQELTDKTIHTQFQQFIGTPAYVSPEQAEMSGLDIDTRSDIYSLGVLLYELLTGVTPFDSRELLASGLDEMRRTIRETEPVRPSTRLTQIRLAHASEKTVVRNPKPEVEEDLDWIVMKCLEKDRTRRYDTANGLAMDLARHLKGEPVLARPPSTAYRFQKLVRRNKLAFAAAGAVLTALVLGLAVALIGLTREAQAKRRALAAEQEAVTERNNAVAQRQRAEAGEQEARRTAVALRRTAYVGDMALVQQATEEGNLARARSLLGRYRDEVGEDDIRGFEWRYLWAQSRTDEAAKLGVYAGFLGGLAVSPDGVYLAGESHAGIEIRSCENYALILTLTNAGGGPIQFSSGGQLLATVRTSGLAIWNTRNWKEKLELPGAQAPFTFTQHEDRIVAWKDARLSIWDVSTGDRIAELSGTVMPGFSRAAIAVSPDGDTVFVGSREQIRSWDLSTKLELKPMDYPLGGWAIGLDVSPQGLLAAAHWNGMVTLWDLKARRLLDTFRPLHLAWVSSVVFSPDGSFLASASSDQNIFLYETKSRKRVRRLNGHEGEIWALQYSRDGQRLISGSYYDESIRLWDLTDASRGPVEVEMAFPLGFADSNRSLICVSPQKGFARVDIRTGSIQPMAGGPVPSEIPDLTLIGALSLAPDGTRAAVVLEGRVQIRSLISGELDLILTNAHGSITCAGFSADGNYLATAAKGSPARMWKTADWSSELLGDPLSVEIGRIAFSRDGSRLALTGKEGGIVLDLASRERIVSLTNNSLGSLAISRDGRFLAAGDQRNTIHLWNLAERRKLGTLLGHVAGVGGLSFSPDGKTLASCGDTSVKLWNVETLQEILTLARFSGTSRAALFSDDGSCLATSSWGDRVQLWRAPSFEEIAATEAREEALNQKP